MAKVFKWIGIVFVGFIAIGILSAIFTNKKADSKVAVTTQGDLKESIPVSNWEYSSDIDKMTSDTVFDASLPAKEELQLQFPYNGGSVATVNVKKKGGENSVFLYVTKGQLIAANAMGNGTIKARFDNDKPEQYSVVGASDYSPNYVFINSESKFIAKMKKAKRLILEAEFFNDGSRQMEFNIEGLSWEH